MYSNMTLDGNASTYVLNGTALALEVSGESIIELSSDRVVLRAPYARLDEGEIVMERGYPCWNPPCRRTVVTLAINGVDFVGRPDPLVYFFFEDPVRIFNMMEQEFWLLVFVLCALSIVNALLTWQWRFGVYERYLRIKYRVKNKVLYPIMYRS